MESIAFIANVNSLIVEMSNLYNISFNNIIESFEKNIMNNEHFLKVNPSDHHNVNKKPNFCITL